MATTGLVVGLTASGYERRYCYEHEIDARKALASLDGAGHIGGPWIKCKGLASIYLVRLVASARIFIAGEHNRQNKSCTESNYFNEAHGR